MWTDYYLVMPDEAAFQPVKELLEAGMVTVDEIGTLYRHDTHEPCDGYHANVRLGEGQSLPPEALPFTIAPPAIPKRLFMPG